MTPNEFKQIRKQLAITQAELARWLGVEDKSRVSKYERGVSGITPVVSALMKAYRDGYTPKIGERK